MQNVLFLYNNFVDVSSVYATSEDSLLPATNLQHRFRTKVWEVNSPVADLVVDMQDAREVTTLAMANHDWQSAPNSLYIEFSNSCDVTSLDSFDAASGQTQAITWASMSATTGNRACLIKVFSLNTDYRYARLRVNADSIWQIGRLYLGGFMQPTLNYLHSGYRVRNEDDSKLSMSVGGQEHIDEIAQFRSVAMSFICTTRAQIDSFMTMFNRVGRRKDWFLCLDYDNKPNEDCLYGKLEADLSWTQPGPNQYQVTLAFHEVR